MTSLRQQAGLTQADVARRSGLPRTAINAYESGSRVPRFDALSRIAGFMTDAAYQLITEAMNDPDPAVQQAAASYKAHQDEMRKPAP